MENLQLNIFKIKDENNIDEIEMIIKEQMKNKRYLFRIWHPLNL